MSDDLTVQLWDAKVRFGKHTIDKVLVMYELRKGVISESQMLIDADNDDDEKLIAEFYAALRKNAKVIKDVPADAGRRRKVQLVPPGWSGPLYCLVTRRSPHPLEADGAGASRVFGLILGYRAKAAKERKEVEKKGSAAGGRSSGNAAKEVGKGGPKAAAAETRPASTNIGGIPFGPGVTFRDIAMRPEARMPESLSVRMPGQKISFKRRVLTVSDLVHKFRYELGQQTLATIRSGSSNPFEDVVALYEHLWENGSDGKQSEERNVREFRNVPRGLKLPILCRLEIGPAKTGKKAGKSGKTAVLTIAYPHPSAAGSQPATAPSETIIRTDPKRKGVPAPVTPLEQALKELEEAVGSPTSRSATTRPQK